MLAQSKINEKFFVRLIPRQVPIILDLQPVVPGSNLSPSWKVKIRRILLLIGNWVSDPEQLTAGW